MNVDFDDSDDDDNDGTENDDNVGNDVFVLCVLIMLPLLLSIL